MPVRDRDRGARAFLDRLAELEQGVDVTVGVHRDDGTEIHRGSKSNQTVGEVAVAQEFLVRRGRGGKKRHHSWLRRSFAMSKRQLRLELVEAAKDYLGGATLEHAFGTPGRTLQVKAQELVAVDTGQLHDTIKVRVRGREVAA